MSTSLALVFETRYSYLVFRIAGGRGGEAVDVDFTVNHLASDPRVVRA